MADHSILFYPDVDRDCRFCIQNFTSADYILIVVAVLELVGIIIALVQNKK